MEREREPGCREPPVTSVWLDRCRRKRHRNSPSSHRDSDIDVEALRETVRNSIISREVWKKRSKNGKPKSETDPKRLEQRQKQIDFGKNTLGYDAYSQAVPRSKRDKAKRYTMHPVTPNIHQVCSKRSFDGQVRKWRRLLHKYDLNESPSTNSNSDDDDYELVTLPQFEYDSSGSSDKEEAQSMQVPVQALSTFASVSSDDEWVTVDDNGQMLPVQSSMSRAMQ